MDAATPSGATAQRRQLEAQRQMVALQLETLRSRAGHAHVSRAAALRVRLRRLETRLDRLAG